LVLLFKDGRELVGFEVELYNVPGALYNVSGIFSKYNLNIVYLDISEITKEIYMLFIVVELGASKVDMNNILNELKNLSNYVKSASIAKSLGNIIYSLKGHIKDVGGHRVILFGMANMEGFIEGVIETFGVELGRTLLFRIGVDVGERAYENYGVRVGVKSVEDAIKLLNALATGFYWGYINKYEIKNDRIILYIKDLWECELWKGKTDKPASSLVKGIIHGFFRKFLNTEVEVDEEKCIAIGDKYCQFKVSIRK